MRLVSKQERTLCTAEVKHFWLGIMEKAKQSQCFSRAEQQYTEARCFTQKSISSQWRLKHIAQGTTVLFPSENYRKKHPLKSAFGLQVDALLTLCMFLQLSTIKKLNLTELAQNMHARMLLYVCGHYSRTTKGTQSFKNFKKHCGHVHIQLLHIRMFHHFSMIFYT